MLERKFSEIVFANLFHFKIIGKVEISFEPLKNFDKASYLNLYYALC